LLASVLLEARDHLWGRGIFAGSTDAASKLGLIGRAVGQQLLMLLHEVGRQGPVVVEALLIAEVALFVGFHVAPPRLFFFSFRGAPSGFFFFDRTVFS